MSNLITSALPLLEGGDTYKVTSPFGWRRDPVSGEGNQKHKGVDLTLWKGWSATAYICAPWDGVVAEMRDNVEGFDKSRSAGNYVIIDHGDGLKSKLYHLAYGSVCVEKGDAVKAGQRVGFMGSTGYSTGAHLHFQLEILGEPIDPMPFLTGEVPEAAGGENDAESMDNTPAEWAKDAVQWAIDRGILKGDEKGDLKLHDPCTREMMLVFLYRTLSGK